MEMTTMPIERLTRRRSSAGMTTRWRSTSLAALALALAACSNSSTGSDDGTPGSELTLLRLTDTAPPLCADSTGAWFVKDPNGQDKEIALTFPQSGDLADCADGHSKDFLRLKIGRMSLLRRPDSTLIS